MTRSDKQRAQDKGRALIQVIFPARLVAVVDRQAEKELLTRSDLVRRAVQQYVQQEANDDRE